MRESKIFEIKENKVVCQNKNCYIGKKPVKFVLKQAGKVISVLLPRGNNPDNKWSDIGNQNRCRSMYP